MGAAHAVCSIRERIALFSNVLSSQADGFYTRLSTFSGTLKPRMQRPDLPRPSGTIPKARRAIPMPGRLPTPFIPAPFAQGPYTGAPGFENVPGVSRAPSPPSTTPSTAPTPAPAAPWMPGRSSRMWARSTPQGVILGFFPTPSSSAEVVAGSATSGSSSATSGSSSGAVRDPRNVREGPWSVRPAYGSQHHPGQENMARIAASFDTGNVASFTKADPTSGINSSGPQYFTTCVGPPTATPASSRRSAPQSSPGWSPAPKRSTCACSSEVAKLQKKMDEVLGHLRRPEPHPEAPRVPQRPEIPGLDLLEGQQQHRTEASESESTTEPWFHVLVDEAEGLSPANHNEEVGPNLERTDDDGYTAAKQEPLSDYEEESESWYVPPTEYVKRKSSKKK